MKRKNFFKLIMVMAMITFIGIGCSDSDDNGVSQNTETIRSGSWTGDGVSFTVSGNPSSVSDFSVTYSGHATGVGCNFDYENTESFGGSFEITDGSFSHNSSSLSFTGNFTDEENIVIKVSWSGSDSNSNCTYSGTREYTAHFVPGSDADMTVVSAYLQTRTYSDYYIYRGWIELSSDGELINASDVREISIKNSSDTPLNISESRFYKENFYSGQWNHAAGSFDSFALSSYSGFSIRFSDDVAIPADEYTYEVMTSSGDSISKTIYFPGYHDMPVPSGLNDEWLDNGGLRLSWSNPSGTYDQLRAVLSDQNEAELLHVFFDSTDAEEIVLSAEQVQKVKSLTSSFPIKWQIQTRNYTEEGMNYARGYSDTVDISDDK